MLKVILMMTTMSGMNQQLEFPNMESCLEVRASILEQVNDAEVVCLPAGAEDLQMRQMDRFFDKFMEMVERIQNRSFEGDYHRNPDFNEFN